MKGRQQIHIVLNIEEVGRRGICPRKAELTLNLIVFVYCCCCTVVALLICSVGYR